MRARALYIAFDVYPRPKGSSSHIASMVKALARDFAPVCVLCLGDGELPPHEESGDITIHRLPGGTRDVLHRATAFAQFVAFHAAQLAGTLSLIVFRDPWGGVPALRVAGQCPAIFEVNALPSWELAYSRPGFSESSTLAAKVGDMERACLREAASVLCVSGVTRNALRQENVPDDRITVIPNAASETYFAAAAQLCPIDELQSGEWCGYIGGLQAWQGVDFLLNAFRLTASGKLLIVHSGNRNTRDLSRQITRYSLQERVKLHGPLPPEELAGVMARLRFTVAPLAETARNTWQGCCPVKIVESMAAGAPVVASDLAVSRELIRHGDNGWLAPAGDARAWAIALERLHNDSALRAKLASRALFTARDNFSQETTHEKLNAVFHAAAARRPIEVAG
ncbi:MAG TPA: glycosyltransferase [Bryobacteraceae bacterium]|nr:glycosyltransferase [Bryobacteraceae bacterium]